MMHSLDKEILIDTHISDLLIPAEKVAHVQIGNPLEHALLVLIKTGYSAVPVLDTEFKLHGILSKTLILDSILGMEMIEVDRLSQMRVEEVMNTKIPHVKQDDEFIKALGLAINHPFLCVENDDGIFKGILTRRAILKLFTRNLKTYS
jgi:CBS domain-containing protein